jgi:hypothetical protein
MGASNNSPAGTSPRHVDRSDLLFLAVVLATMPHVARYPLHFSIEIGGRQRQSHGFCLLLEVRAGNGGQWRLCKSLTQNQIITQRYDRSN